jgi:hypothetical protein
MRYGSQLFPIAPLFVTITPVVFIKLYLMGREPGGKALADEFVSSKI